MFSKKLDVIQKEEEEREGEGEERGGEGQDEGQEDDVDNNDVEDEGMILVTSQISISSELYISSCSSIDITVHCEGEKERHRERVCERD